MAGVSACAPVSPSPPPPPPPPPSPPPPSPSLSPSFAAAPPSRSLCCRSPGGDGTASRSSCSARLADSVGALARVILAEGDGRGLGLGRGLALLPAILSSSALRSVGGLLDSGPRTAPTASAGASDLADLEPWRPSSLGAPRRGTRPWPSRRRPSWHRRPRVTSRRLSSPSKAIALLGGARRLNRSARALGRGFLGTFFSRPLLVDDAPWRRTPRTARAGPAAPRRGPWPARRRHRPRGALARESRSSLGLRRRGRPQPWPASWPRRRRLDRPRRAAFLLGGGALQRARRAPCLRGGRPWPARSADGRVLPRARVHRRKSERGDGSGRGGAPRRRATSVARPGGGFLDRLGLGLGRGGCLGFASCPRTPSPSPPLKSTPMSLRRWRLEVSGLTTRRPWPRTRSWPPPRAAPRASGGPLLQFLTSAARARAKGLGLLAAPSPWPSRRSQMPCPWRRRRETAPPALPGRGAKSAFDARRSAMKRTREAAAARRRQKGAASRALVSALCLAFSGWPWHPHQPCSRSGSLAESTSASFSHVRLRPAQRATSRSALAMSCVLTHSLRGCWRPAVLLGLGDRSLGAPSAWRRSGKSRLHSTRPSWRWTASSFGGVGLVGLGLLGGVFAPASAAAAATVASLQNVYSLLSSAAAAVGSAFFAGCAPWPWQPWQPPQPWPSLLRRASFSRRPLGCRGAPSAGVKSRPPNVCHSTLPPSISAHRAAAAACDDPVLGSP